MQFELASRLAAIPKQVSCDIAGEVSISNLRNGVHFGLNRLDAQEPRVLGELASHGMVEKV